MGDDDDSGYRNLKPNISSHKVNQQLTVIDLSLVKISDFTVKVIF